MIIVITCTEKNEKTGHWETLVSHGVDSSTGRNVVLSCEPIEYYTRQGLCKFCTVINQYVIDNEDEEPDSI